MKKFMTYLGLFASGVVSTQLIYILIEHTTMKEGFASLSKSVNNVVEDVDCSHFMSHNEAQQFFESKGGTDHDIYNLDKDKDGTACESLI